ncbi:MULTISPECIES: RHS repeat-associated core domain-containing protein [unclassified Streptomyces]|uniref:RHS repeat-associated core domain-containing protein n=2 Tax=Streptomyces TaxID=1883 RepID=UPI0033ACAB5C
MRSRASGTSLRRARRSSRYGLVAAVAALSLAASVVPALAEPAAADPAPVSVWGKTDGPRLGVPPVKVGSNRPVPNEAEAPDTPGEKAWEEAQKNRTAGKPAQKRSMSAPAAQSDSGEPVTVPGGQGAVPWHQITNFRITDSLVARINLSTGNLMLAATDFEVAGVGQKLRLARTYNSFDGAGGLVSPRWWQEYERSFWRSENEVVLTDATGATLRFAKASDGSFTTPKGYAKDLKENADYTFTLTDRKSGTKDTYDANGVLTKVTDRNKGTITVEHREGGFKLTETRSGRWIDLAYTDENHLTAKDHTGRTASYELDGGYNLSRTTDTAGKTTLYAHDADGRITKITTPDGRITVFTYDAQNRVRSMLRATSLGGSGHTGPTYTYAYSSTDPQAAGTTTVTDPENHATKYEHDKDGRVTKTTDALTHSRSKTYDANNNVTTATDAMGTGTGGTGGNVTTYGWDGRNNPTSAKLPTGATAAMTGYQTIAGADLPGSMTTADDEKTDYTYDAAGNTTSVAITGTGGGKQTFEHNKATPTCGGFEGQRCKATVKMTDTKSVSTSFTYDAKGNLAKVTPPAPLGTTTYTYDQLGRPQTVTDGRGIKTTYTYDARDRVVQVSTPTTTVVYVYDGDGNLVQRTDGSGITSYAFDPLSRETVRTLQDGSQTQLTYTPAGNVDTYTDPAGTTDYTYNEVNNLTELKDPTGKVTKYEYDNNDTRTKTTYPGGTVQSVTPDKSSRPEKIKTTSPQGTLVDLTYSYANGTKDGGKIRTKTDAVGGYKTSYTYDSAGRFSYAKDEKNGTIADSWQYCYDQAGNLTSQGTDPGCPRGTTYTYNDAQQLTAKSSTTGTWSYDQAGNETAGASTDDYIRTGESYTDYSQLKSITVGGKTYAGQYASTDQSERIKLGDTLFHHGPLGLSAKTTAGTDMGFNREPGGTLNSMTTGGKSYYYLTDALGSVVALADGDGNKVNTYTYSPRGVRLLARSSEPVAQPYRFAGGYQDPTGLYHLAARYYDANIGRFTQPDPSGQEKNPYLYAEGDPVNRIDPTGLLSLDGAVDALGNAGDLIGAGVHLAQGDTRALWGDVAGLVVGGLATTACGAAVAATAAPTLGTSLGATVGCYAIGWSAGQIASNAVGG